jgi:signal transduction histidine kinase
MEGFRVLPYGERSNDWLQLDRHYSDRMRSSEYLKEFGFASAEQDDDRNALLQFLPNRSYYGCVFLTQQGAPNLQMLVNREGFIPNDSFDALTRLVRLGLDLTVRARAAAKISKRQGAGAQTKPASEEPQSLEAAVTSLADVRGLIAKGQIQLASASLERAEEQIQTLAETANAEATMLRILASVGSQMSAFVHEINAALGMAEGVERSIERLIEQEHSAATRRDLNRTRKSIGDLRRQLERQASYLVDINGPDARRRRSRNVIADRFDAAARLLTRVAEQRDVTMNNEIPADLKSPPMFPAELTSVFTNLLTNAIKAAGKGGKIRATGKAIESGGSNIRVENTGVKVDLKEAERWFKAFESTTANVDTVLGQGMGLGLTITRNMLEQYGATIEFVQPLASYSTAVRIQFPK